VVAGCRSGRVDRGEAAELVPPWQLPAADLETQQLFRLRIRAGADEASLRLALRLRDAGRFELAASDPLGRSLWTLTIDGAVGIWRDRDGTTCRLDPEVSRPWPRLGFGMPARDLPALLLDRLPSAPMAGDVGVAPDGRTFAFEDTFGRRWEGVLADGRPVSWRREVAGERPLTWTREEGGARLRVESEELFELFWRAVSREPLRLAPRLSPGPRELPECRYADLL